jgi:serine/threonine-protein kinase
VLSQLVSGSTANLLPGRASDTIPPEPFRQLWYASADMTLENVRIDPIQLRSQVTEVMAADVPASGARLFAVRLPALHSLALGVNGTPLLQMAVFAADGTPLSPRGPLRVVSLAQQKASQVQLLVTNEGVAPARISLSLRADPPAAPAEPGVLPGADSAVPANRPPEPPPAPATPQKPAPAEPTPQAVPAPSAAGSSTPPASPTVSPSPPTAPPPLPSSP